MIVVVDATAATPAAIVAVAATAAIASRIPASTVLCEFSGYGCCYRANDSECDCGPERGGIECGEHVPVDGHYGHHNTDH